MTFNVPDGLRSPIQQHLSVVIPPRASAGTRRGAGSSSAEMLTRSRVLALQNGAIPAQLRGDWL